MPLMYGRGEAAEEKLLIDGHARHLGTVGFMPSSVERSSPIVTVRMSECPMKEHRFGPRGKSSSR